MTDEQFIERLVHEAYAAHCMLTNLGYEPEEVQAGVQNIANGDPPGPYACVVLSRGGNRFVIHLQPVNDAQAAAFEKAWRAFAAAKPSMPREALDAIVKGAEIYARRVDLLVALDRKGFSIEPGRMTN